MVLRKALRLATIIAASVGVVSTTAVTGILVANSDSSSGIFAGNTRHYKGEWYNEGALVYEGYFKRGQPVKYDGTTPTKTDYTGENIYIFSGWDYTGDKIADIPVTKAYSNFKANACYTTIPASLLEKIDWQKLLEILMDKNIDLEALLAKLGLSPEDIAKLLNLNVMTIKSNVLGPAYLRTESFKDYKKSGSNWTDADYYPLSNISEGSVNPLQYTANKLSSLKNNPLIASYCQEGTYEITYNKSGGKYPVIAFESNNYQNLATDSYSLVNIGEDRTYVSTGYPLIPCTEETIIAGMLTNYSNNAIKSDEEKYREYARKEYLAVDSDYKTYFTNLADQIGATTNNVGQAVTAFTEYLTENFTLDYKHNEFPKKEDPLLYFMNEAKVADPNYFATAMTLFLRSLGYPARYTQGYMGAIAEANVETPVTALQAYSWCEVYVDGIGWMNADGAEYLLVKLFNEYYELPEEILDMMDFSNKGTSKLLDHIYIGDNTKTNYVGGSTFYEGSDVELMAVYDDGSEQKVNPCFVSIPDISDYKSYYDREVMVLYEYLSDIKSASYTIHVEPARIEQLQVFNDAQYTTVSVINPSDFYFKGLYNNGQTYDVDPNLVQFNIPEIEEPGDYPVEFTFTEFYSDDSQDYKTVTSTFNLHIEEEPFIVEIQPLSWLPSVFYTDEGVNFDRDNWLAIRSNGEQTQIQILDEYCLNPDVLYAKAPGEYTLQIQPEETCEIFEYNFEIKENVLQKLDVYPNEPVFYMQNDQPYELKTYDLLAFATYTKDFDNREIPFENLVVSQTIFENAGIYVVDVSYTETFEYAGEITLTTQVEININANELDELETSHDYLYVHYGEEITRELYSGASIYGVRENGDIFPIDYNNPNLNFDFSNVDRFTPGLYEVPITYIYHDGYKSVTTIVYINVVGIKEFKPHFENVPEKILCDTKYTTDDFSDWNISGEVTYYGGNDYEYTETVFIGDERLSVEFDSPFSDAGEYELFLVYDDGYQQTGASTSLTAVPYGIDYVEFDVSSVNGTTIKYDESIDHDLVSATVYYKDDSERTMYFTDGQIKVDLESLGGEPEQVRVTYSITLDDKTYSDNSAVVTIKRPVEIQSEVNIPDYIFNGGYSPDINLFNTYLVYDDGSSETVSKDKLSVNWADTPEPGYNDVIISYTDGTYSFDTTLEVQTVIIEFEVILEDKNYFEGDYITTNDFDAYLNYYFGGLNLDYSEEVTSFVSVYNENLTLVGGLNALTFVYYDEGNDQEFHLDTTIDAYYIDHIEVDSSKFKSDYLRLDDTPDFSVIKVTAVFMNDEGDIIERNIPISDCIISGFDTLTNGENRAFSVTCNIGSNKFVEYIYYNVYEPVATNVVLDDKDCSLFAYEGLAEGIIDLSSMKYIVTYENGKTETFYYSEYNSSTTVSYTAPYISNSTPAQVLQFVFNYGHNSHSGYETFGPLTSNITIYENKVESLQIDKSKVQTTFYVGQEFNADGLIVYSISSAYKDFPTLGKAVLSSGEYTVDVGELTLGKNTVTILYNLNPNVKTSYEVELKEDYVSRVTPYNYPSTVKQGDPIDLSNLSLGVYYASGKYEETRDFEITKLPSSEKVGNTSFEITYKGKVVATPTITIIENKSTLQGISASPYNILVVEGDLESYQEQYNSIQVEGYFLDEDSRILNPSEYKITGSVDINKVGSYTLTVTATVNGISKKSNIYVTVSESLKPTGVYIVNEHAFTLGEDYDPEAFLNNAQIYIYYNIQDAQQTTMADAKIVYYTLPEPISTDKQTDEDTTETVIVLIVVEVNGVEYEFEVELVYEVR